MTIQARKIRFITNWLDDAQVTAAITADRAINQDINNEYVERDQWGNEVATKQVVEYSDETSGEYPNLRSALKKLPATYDFHQRRPEDGDNAIWHHLRNGKEILSNNGLSGEDVPPL